MSKHFRKNIISFVLLLAFLLTNITPAFASTGTPESQPDKTITAVDPATDPVKEPVTPTPDPVIEEKKEEPIKEEPIKEAPPVEEPAVVPPVKEAPPVEEPAVVPPVKEAPPVEEPAVVPPVKEAPPVEEPAVVPPVKETPPVEEPAVVPPVKEAPPVEEPAVVPPVKETPPVEEPSVVPPVKEPQFSEKNPPLINKGKTNIPQLFTQGLTTTTLPDTIAVSKTAVRCPGCRTFEVTLKITGELQRAPVDVVLVIDVSTSMGYEATKNPSRNRLYYAKAAAINFAGKVLGAGGIAGSRVSIVSFNGSLSGNGSQSNATTNLNFTNNLTTVTNTINSLTPTGATNSEAGFLQAKSVVQGANSTANKVVVFLTDGLPTVSNGTNFSETTNTSNVRFTSAITAAKSIFNNDIADVFTIGLITGLTGAETTAANYFLTQAQNKGYYSTPSASDLDSIFNSISESLGYSAKNGVVVDKIGDNFDLLDPSSLPSGATYNSTTREITWNPGTIGTSEELKYKVQAKSSFISGLAKTNEYANLTYTNVNGETGKTKTFPVPMVEVPTKLQVSLTDAAINLGDSISLGNYMSAVTGGDNNGIFTYQWRKVGDATYFSTVKNPTVTPLETTQYELTVTDSNGCIVIATMTVTPSKAKISITGKKVWVDGPTTHPSIQLQLFRNGVIHLAPVTLLDGTESYTWTDLDKTDSMGVDYVYTVDEVAVPTNYEKSISKDKLTVTNTYTSPKTSVTGKKVWVNGPTTHPTIQLQLFRNGVIHLAPVNLLDGTLSYTWTDLDKTDSQGVAYVYTVDEVAVPTNYVKSNSKDKLTVTNTYVSPKTSVTGKKVWVNGPTIHPTIQLQLFRNGEIHLTPVTLLDGTLSHTWSDLDKTDSMGVDYVYTVDEVAVPTNYEKSISKDKLTVTNTYTSPKTSVTGKKVWVNGPTTHPTIQLQLFRNDVAYLAPATLLDGTLSHTWSDLDKTDSMGVDYVYTVDEVAVPTNYEKSISKDKLTVTNTYTSPKTSITGKKVWVNGPTTHPTIQLQLFRNDVAYLAPATLLDGTLSHTWSDLDKTDSMGVDYVYTVDEVSVPTNYEKSISKDKLTVTNTYTSPKTSITGKKVWVNGPTIHPTIQLQLFRNGELHLTPVTLLDGTLSYTWTDLDKTDSMGVDYVYTIDEVSVPTNYVKSNSKDKLTVTNTYVSPKTSVTGKKVWVNGPTIHPTIQLQLFRNGEIHLTPVTLLDGTLSHTWSDLDKTDSMGVDYVYTVDEVAVPTNYEKSISKDKLTVTNTYTSPKTSVTGKKVWVNGPTTHPTIQLQLFRNDVAYLAPATLLDGTLSHTWSDLDKTDSMGVDYVYTVDEVAVPTNYEKSISQDKLTITNTYISPKTSVTANKIWVDGPTTHPTIMLQLYRNGSPFLEKVTLLDGTLSYTWSDLDKTDSEGVDYVYTITEDPVEGYISSINGFEVTNDFDEGQKDISINKSWIGGPEVKPAITINLLADGISVRQVTLNGTNEYTFTELPIFNSDGTTIVYTITEDPVEGYISSIDGFEVTNDFDEGQRDIPVEKIWVGGPEVKPVVTINLLADGEKVAEFALNGITTHTFTGLPIYNSDGTTIIYTITENPVEGYISSIDGFKVTNDFDEGLKDISIEKIWVGGPETKPAITINLLADGMEIRQVTLIDMVNYTFTGLPIMKSDGTVINYTITEDPVAGYISSINGFEVTNDFDEGLKDIPVNKIWVGGPLVKPSITINLMADGTDVDSVVLENGTTEYIFKDLPVYNSDGTTIVYAISENYVPGYISSIEGFTATNDFDESSRGITVTKVWEGGIGARPTITINLLADGVEVAQVELPAGDTEHTFTGLPVFKSDGTAIVYTITEDPTENYETTIEEFTVFNTWNGELPYTGTNTSTTLPIAGLLLAFTGVALVMRKRHNT